MAVQSGKPVAGTRVRVYYSSPDNVNLEAGANIIALSLERGLGQKGSSIQPQTGRWDNRQENGYIIEIVSAEYGTVWAADIVRDELQGLVLPLGATYYVTLDEVTCMEIF